MGNLDCKNYLVLIKDSAYTGLGDIENFLFQDLTDYKIAELTAEELVNVEAKINELQLTFDSQTEDYDKKQQKECSHS